MLGGETLEVLSHRLICLVREGLKSLFEKFNLYCFLFALFTFAGDKKRVDIPPPEEETGPDTEELLSGNKKKKKKGCCQIL